MLKSLYIKNYLLIDELDMEFDSGFTTITGETGAGKSILMGALSLILGQRVDTSVLRLKDAKCVLEGSFICHKELEPLFSSNDLDFETLSTIRREIAPGGKSRAFVNDTPVNLPLLRELGKLLVDIHSQYQNLQLNEQAFQLEVVDFLSAVDNLRSDYQKAYYAWKDAAKELEEQRVSIEKLKADQEYLQFQFDELSSAQIREGELEELEAELQRAEHAEEIGIGLANASGTLNLDMGVLEQLAEAHAQLNKIADFYAPVRSLAERMESARIELKDLGYELELLAGMSEPEPGKLDKLQERIDLLYGLLQKHRLRDLEGLLALREDLKTKVDAITFSDEQLAQLEKERDRLFGSVEKLARQLHDKREKAGSQMEDRIVSDLVELGIPNARFSVQVQLNGEYTPSGADRVNFLFSANRQMEQEEVGRVA